MSCKISSQESQNCNFKCGEWDVEFSRIDNKFYFSKEYENITTKKIIKVDPNIFFTTSHFRVSLGLFDNFTMITFDCLKNYGLLTEKFIRENLFLYSVEILIILDFYIEKEIRDRFFGLVRANNMEILKIWKDVFYEDMSFEEILAQVLVIFQ